MSASNQPVIFTDIIKENDMQLSTYMKTSLEKVQATYNKQNSLEKLFHRKGPKRINQLLSWVTEGINKEQFMTLLIAVHFSSSYLLDEALKTGLFSQVPSVYYPSPDVPIHRIIGKYADGIFNAHKIARFISTKYLKSYLPETLYQEFFSKVITEHKHLKENAQKLKNWLESPEDQILLKQAETIFTNPSLSEDPIFKL